MKYWCLVTTRNRPQLLTQTLDSLIHQTLPPTQIIVYDDGSTPPLSLKSDLIKVLRREDEGYDITRIARNWNACFTYALESGLASKTDLVLITADDSVFPTHYAEELTTRMVNDEVAIASGSRGLKNLDGWKPPEGCGRMVTHAFMEEIGFKVPEQGGYESWMIYESLRNGFNVKCYDDIHYSHRQDFGSEHSFVEWGQMEHSLGYDPLFFILRCSKNIMTGDIPRMAVPRILLHYMKGFIVKPSQPYWKPFPKELRRFVRRMQHERLKSLMKL